MFRRGSDDYDLTLHSFACAWPDTWSCNSSHIAYVPLTGDARRGGTRLRCYKYDYELHIPGAYSYPALRTFVMSRHRVSLLSQGCTLLLSVLQ